MASSNKSLVSFVVLNWNGIQDTLLCINSIRNQSYKNYEIIVVDNGSSQDQKKILSDIKNITYVDLTKNTGFTGGQIAAYQLAKGDFIALINNDSVISKDWTERALETFKSTSKVAVVGGRAYLWNDELKYKSYDTSNPYYSYQVVSLNSGHTKTVMYGSDQALVNSISGSGVMIRRTVIDRVGYFDNQFFAYYEETDLFARYKRAGYKVMYNPQMSTWHKIAQSTRSKPDFYLYYMHRNRFLFATKNYDRHFMLRFFKTYCIEWLLACYRVTKHGRSQQREAVNLIKAGIWNFTHLPGTLIKRRHVLQLGKSYSKKLLADSAESVTVVIPCYNYANYVSEAIESVLNQTMLPSEILVINDGSTDNSLAKIQKYKQHVKIIDQKNSGVIITKNTGMAKATGDWVIFLDADDKMKPTYIADLMGECRQRNSDVTYSGMVFFGNEKGRFMSRPYSEYSLLKGNYINNSALIRKSLLLQTGGYKQDMSFGYEDWELYITLAEHKAIFAYVRKPLLMYRRHSASSRDNVASLKLDKAHEIVVKLHPTMFSTKHRLLSFYESAISFHKHRTPIQYIKDVRYLIVTNLDKKSKDSPLLTKVLGFGRLLKKGDFSMIIRKVMVNFNRILDRLK